MDIQEALLRLKKLIIEEHGIIDFPWCSHLLYPYYNHFKDDSTLIVAGSLVAFWGLLLEWEDGSGMPFCAGSEDYDCHDFERYVVEFMNCYERNKQIAPTTCKIIIQALNSLIERVDLRLEFSIINEDIINRLKVFSHEKYTTVHQGDYILSLEEADFGF